MYIFCIYFVHCCTLLSLTHYTCCRFINLHALLEKHFLTWIIHHDSTHGGRVPLQDNILIQQAKIIAQERHIEFDPI